MPIYINGTLASSLVYNGTTITTAYYNGVQVLSPPVQTSTPYIPSFAYFNAWYINITNNDSSSADIYAEANDSTPDIFRGNFGSGQTQQVIDNSQPSFATFTYYVTAQAAGKLISNVYSRTIT